MIREFSETKDTTFDKEVLHATIPVIANFSAPWCEHSRNLDLVLHKIADTMSNELIIFRINVDDNPQLVEKYAIKAVPLLLFISDGKVVYRESGFLPERPMRDVVISFLQTSSQSFDLESYMAKQKEEEDLRWFKYKKQVEAFEKTREGSITARVQQKQVEEIKNVEPFYDNDQC